MIRTIIFEHALFGEANKVQKKMQIDDNVTGEEISKAFAEWICEQGINFLFGMKED